jgi:type 1 glutamine amidotransferase
MRNIMIFGDYASPKFHPFAGADAALRAALSPLGEVSLSEHPESFPAEALGAFDLIVLYQDNWSDKVGTWPWIVGNLLRYILAGGRLLAAHYPAVCETDELARMVGARFRMHPPCGPLTLVPTEGSALSFEPVALTDEAYHFSFDRLGTPEFLAEYRAGDVSLPAAWRKSYGLGRVGYFAPGHTAASFDAARPALTGLARLLLDN